MGFYRDFGKMIGGDPQNSTPIYTKKTPSNNFERRNDDHHSHRHTQQRNQGISFEMRESNHYDQSFQRALPSNRNNDQNFARVRRRNNFYET